MKRESEKIRILGIDPGVARMGYGVIENIKGTTTCMTYGCLTTPRTLAHPERLYSLQTEVRRLIREFKPSAVAVETIRFAQNSTTGISVAEARGVVLAAIAEAHVQFIELTPLDVKQALTSYGHAEKKQVQFMVKQVLKLKETPEPDDAADALAVAIAAEPRLKLYGFNRT